MTIKAIALDMDGTLLDAENNIHSNLINIISDLRHKGTKIFLATGRTREEIEDILPPEFPYDGAVTSNGMGCYTKEKDIMQYQLNSDLVDKVINLAHHHQIYYEVHSLQGKRLALLKDRDMMEQELNKTIPKSLKTNEINSRKKALKSGITWIKELVPKNIVKIYFFSMNQDQMKQWKTTLEQVKQTKSFSTSSSSLHNVEIMKENVSKATGLNTLLKEYNLSPQELMAIGDGENDLPMFGLSSFSVAMANAPITVKEKADVVTQYSYDNHGLYSFLKSIKTQIQY